MSKVNLFERTILSNPVLRATEVVRYSGIETAKREDIMQHTSQVSLMSYFLALKLVELGETNLDIGELLEKALVHDIDETITGDIPRPTKYYSSGIYEGIKEMAEVSAKLIVEKYVGVEDKQLQQRVLDSLQECKAGATGVIIRVTDLLGVAYKCFEELALLGNYKFVKVANDALEYLKELVVELNSHKESQTNLLTDASLDYLIELVTDSRSVVCDLVEQNKDILRVMDYEGHTLVQKSKE